MATLADVATYQSSIRDLATLTIADLVAFWRTLDTEDAARSAEAIREFLPELLDSYVPLAAEAGAAFYDTERASAGAGGSFIASPVVAVDGDRVQETIGWGIAPLFRRSQGTNLRTGDLVTMDIPAPDPDLALSRLSGATQREVAGGARVTVEDNVEKDPAKPRFARHASSNACAFCALLASRGPVYRSAQAAGDGHKYHDHCHCVAVPVWGDKYEAAPYVAQWESAYKQAYKATGKADTTAILAHMRQTLGTD